MSDIIKGRPLPRGIERLAQPLRGGTPLCERQRIFYKCFCVTLSTEAPHNAALQPQVVLRGATEVRIEVVELDRSQGNMLR